MEEKENDVFKWKDPFTTIQTTNFQRSYIDYRTSLSILSIEEIQITKMIEQYWVFTFWLLASRKSVINFVKQKNENKE